MSPRRGKRTGPPPRKPSPGNPWPKKLRAFRKTRGNITQAEAAALAGVATRTWIAWENSQTQPSELAKRILRDTLPELLS